MRSRSTSSPWLRYTHLEKLYGYLPGMADALPGIFGLTKQEYDTQRTAYSGAACRIATDLVRDDPAVAELVDAIPIAAGQHILVVGDSITDDLQSWVEILRHLVQLRRPGDGITLTNGGLSAHTTAMILRRWPATLTGATPDLIICALGGNDVTRIGPSANKTVVSREESIANLQELRRIAAETSAAAWVWMTPAPVLEDRVQQHPPFRFGASEWRNADILLLARAMTEFPEPTVDLTTAFGVPANPGLLGADGVHPTLAGQRAITIALLETLSAANGAHQPRKLLGSADEQRNSEAHMSRVTCNLSISADGYSAGHDQSENRPFGDDGGDGWGDRLHAWMFDNPEENRTGLDQMTDARAYVMGRNMFGPVRGEWDRQWNGWWGDDPPFHAPVFVLTHHPRDPQPMDGGTTYHFVTEGIESALAQARESAGVGEVSIHGGACTINQYLAAGLIDELPLHILPITLGSGTRLFDGVRPLNLEQVDSRAASSVTHVTYRVLS